MTRSRDLSHGSIAAHFRALAIPAAIGMVFSTLYNVVDVYFAGWLDTGAQAGLAVAYQVFFLLITFGIGLGSAMGALVGGGIGGKAGASTRGFGAQGIILGGALSVALTALGLWFGPDLIALLTTEGRYQDYATGYFNLLIFATPGFVLAYGANGILQAQGDTVSMQYALMAAFFANIVLNPLMIWGIPGVVPGLGFNGIALSTVISQTGVMIFILWRVFQSPLGKTFVPQDFRVDWAVCGTVAMQMLPASFALVIMISSGFIVQYYLKAFGEEAVAAYGVAIRIEQLFLLPVVGLTGALLPIAAHNFGAGLHDRVRQSVFDCWKFGFAFMCIACPVLWIAATWLMRFFTQDPEVIRLGTLYLHIDGVLLPAYMVLFSVNSLLQALRKPIWSLWIGLYRQAFGVAFFVWVFVHVLDFGIPGVWFGIATAVLTGLALSLLLAESVARPLIGGLFAARSTQEVHAAVDP